MPPARRPHATRLPLIGYARDGHPIYGPRGAGGKLVHNRDLDACHGRWENVTANGRRRRKYRYRQTGEFPYLIGCFRAVPASDWQADPVPGTDPFADVPVGQAPEPHFTFSTGPSLFPAFDRAVFDYAIRCGGDPVHVDVAAAGPTSVSIDGALPHPGTFAADVALDEGQAFTVIARAGGPERRYHVRCLPQAFPPYTFTRTGTPSQEFYAVTPPGPGGTDWIALFDAHGVPVWFQRRSPPPIDAKVLPDGTIAYSTHYGAGGFGFDPLGRYEIERPDGTLVRTLRTVGTVTDFHDLQLTPEGNYLMDSYVPRDHVDLTPYGGPSDATVLDAEIQEVDPEGGLVWSWSTKDHLSLDESMHWWSTVIGNPTVLPDGRTAYDQIHLNSLQPVGGSIIFSTRHTDAVYRIDRATGDIEWKLGGTTRPESLSILGDPLVGTRFGGQRDARLQPDGTLTLHDNGTAWARPPAALRYRLDTVAHTATLLESVSDPDITDSFCCGSARRVADGGWVISWGGEPRVTEFGPDGARRFTLDFDPGQFSFRADPVPAGRIDRHALRDGMDALYPRP